MASGSGWNLWVWLAGGGCGWNLWVWLAEVYRLHILFCHLTYELDRKYAPGYCITLHDVDVYECIHASECSFLVAVVYETPDLFCCTRSESLCTRMVSKGKTPAMVTAQVMPSTPVEQTISTDQLPGSQFAALLAAIRDCEHRLDRKLADFKADVQQAQDEAATKAVNRVRNDRPYQYKKKAHEEQARSNAQVEESVQEAHDALATIEDSQVLQCTREALEKGARLLAERQKLIKIADRSDNGWGS